MEQTQMLTQHDKLGIHTRDDVCEEVDPRVHVNERATDSEIEQGLARQAGEHILHPHHEHSGPLDKKVHAMVNVQESPRPTVVEAGTKETVEEKEEGGPLYVEHGKSDSRDPMNFSYRKKWTITLVACMFTCLSAAASSSYSQGYASMIPEFDTTQSKASLGLSMYCLGFGIVPLFTASLSEEFGRMPLYVVSATGFMLTHMMIALAQNIETVIVGRFLNGAFGSTGATMVGGTIADIWATHERGLPMTIYSISAMGSVGIGACAAAWIEVNKHMNWRWIQWIHMIVTGAYIIAILVIMKETRSGVLLTRLARKLRRETGNQRYRARVEDERGSLRTLIYISLTRPIYLLFTEPVVFSFSAWVGFAWGLLYGLVDSIGPVFRDLHGFSNGLRGTVFLSITVGSMIGLATNSLFQEPRYARNVAKRGPEARLYAAMFAAVLFPAGMLIYAWCSFPQVPWIALVIGIVLFIWALFIIYSTVFTYLADCYGSFASSALAGQSLARNIMGTVFPLFTNQLYDAISYKWANTLFALLAVVMIPIPYVLFFYGPKIRARSKFASQVMKKS